MSAVESTQSSLNSEAETEAAKFGEDVKYLAEFTNRQALTSSNRVICKSKITKVKQINQIFHGFLNRPNT